MFKSPPTMEGGQPSYTVRLHLAAAWDPLSSIADRDRCTKIPWDRPPDQNRRDLSGTDADPSRPRQKSQRGELHQSRVSRKKENGRILNLVNDE